GRFINREGLGARDGVRDAAKKLKEGKVVDAIWELTATPAKTTEKNAGKLVQESPILNMAGQAAATAYGGPLGAAAYASWSTYRRTEDRDSAIRAEIMAAVSTAAVNDLSRPPAGTPATSSASSTSSPKLWNEAVARKAIEGGAIIGLFAAATGENG